MAQLIPLQHVLNPISKRKSPGDKLELVRFRWLSRMQQDDRKMPSDKNYAPMLINICVWILYIGIVMPGLALIGIHFLAISTRQMRPGPVVQPIPFMLGGAILGFALLSPTRHILRIIEYNRKKPPTNPPVADIAFHDKRCGPNTEAGQP